MFGSLTEKLTQLVRSLGGKRQLTEENISDAIKQVRLALLDADVNYTVASRFVHKVKEKCLGTTVLASATPDQQFIKIMHDELTALMGSEEEGLVLREEPTVIMLCGLQGSGKTTQCAKLGAYLHKQDPKRKIILAACDLQRPAAVEQLCTLGKQAELLVFTLAGEKDPNRVAKEALVFAKKEQAGVLILDTAGRLHIDDALMEELAKIKQEVKPQEVLFVASAAMGQDAVKTALEFHQRVGITGSILTMLDGTARAGAAISIREVTGMPLKFEGIGEKLGDLQPFHPKSMADRILGMGDVVNLMRKVQEHVTEEEEAELEKKMLKGAFTYQDYIKQMSMFKKMGPLKGILKMIPGMPSLDQIDLDEKEFTRVESMILSMTVDERTERVELVPSRRRRIAAGSGTKLDDVNRLVKNFKKMKQLCKELPALQKQMQKRGGNKEKFLWR
ncbi:MAG: signal recognition particle protein [Chlamydiae bacterium]|nr:signal recognition particle protein [Chlamydiota bacterium]